MLKFLHLVRNFFKNQNGQSLVEIVATISIGAVLILALVALSVRSNRSSDFSKADSQASKLASEGIEIIKGLSIRNVGGTGCPTGNPCPVKYHHVSADPATPNPDCTETNTFSHTTNFSDLFAFNMPDENCATGEYGSKGHLHQPGTDPDCPAASDPWCLHLLTNTTAHQVTVDTRTFTRWVYVADTPTSLGGLSGCNSTSTDWNEIKQFTVVVDWVDPSGTHSSVSTTCIRR